MSEHCLHGHELTAANTYIDPRGKRECIQCRRARRSEYGKRVTAQARLKVQPKVCSECSQPFIPCRSDALVCGEKCRKIRRLRVDRESWAFAKEKGRTVRRGQQEDEWSPPIPGLPCGMGEWEQAADWGIRHEPVRGAIHGTV